MRRKMADTIRAWRASRGEECLLIKGARQVRKTYIVREVEREDYESFIEVNFIERPAVHQAFESDLSSPEILKRLSLVIPNVSFPAGKTLLGEASKRRQAIRETTNSKRKIVTNPEGGTPLIIQKGKRPTTG